MSMPKIPTGHAIHAAVTASCECPKCDVAAGTRCATQYDPCPERLALWRQRYLDDCYSQLGENRPTPEKTDTPDPPEQPPRSTSLLIANYEINRVSSMLADASKLQPGKERTKLLVGSHVVLTWLLRSGDHHLT